MMARFRTGMGQTRPHDARDAGAEALAVFDSGHIFIERKK